MGLLLLDEWYHGLTLEGLLLLVGNQTHAVKVWITGGFNDLLLLKPFVLEILLLLLLM